MINQNSSRAFGSITFKQGFTQMEKVKFALEQVGPLSDRELSEVTGIPRHLVPARRGELVKLGVVKRLKSAYDSETRQTVDVWATDAYMDKLETRRACEAVKAILARSERQISKVVAGGLFCLAIFIFSGVQTHAHTVIKKTTITTRFAQGVLKPSTTPTPTIRIQDPKYTAKITQTPEKNAVKELVCKYFGNQCEIATAIFFAESGLRCEAVGDGGLAYFQDGVEYGKSYGVAQIRHLPGRPDPGTLLDCESNIRHAYGMWQAQGWNPWSAYKNGAYQKYLSIN